MEQIKHMHGDMTMGSGSTGSSMGSSMSGMNHTSSSSGMMMMPMTFGTPWKDTPVLFTHLVAHNRAQVFGIFCLIFFTAFIYRGVVFFTSYLDQYVYPRIDKQRNAMSQILPQPNTHKGEFETSSQSSSVITLKNDSCILKQFFQPSATEISRDFFKLIMTFTSTLLAYCLMLVTMTFVLPYFFAVVCGVAFGEIFFSRWRSLLKMNAGGHGCGSSGGSEVALH